MKKYIWGGPCGYNPLIGDVKTGGEYSLSPEQAKKLLKLNLIQPKIVKPIKKEK